MKKLLIIFALLLVSCSSTKINSNEIVKKTYIWTHLDGKSETIEYTQCDIIFPEYSKPYLYCYNSLQGSLQTQGTFQTVDILSLKEE